MTPEQAQLVSRYLRADADRAANSDDRNLLREAADIVESAAAKTQTPTADAESRLRATKEELDAMESFCDTEPTCDVHMLGPAAKTRAEIVRGFIGRHRT